MKQKRASVPLTLATAAVMLAAGTISPGASEVLSSDQTIPNNILQTFLRVVQGNLNTLFVLSSQGLMLPPDQTSLAFSDASKLLKEIADGKADRPEGQKLTKVKVAAAVPPAVEKSVDLSFKAAVKALNGLAGSAYFCAEISPPASAPVRTYVLECNFGSASI